MLGQHGSEVHGWAMWWLWPARGLNLPHRDVPSAAACHANDIVGHLRDDIQLATGCIEWSCKAVLETPSLKLEPVLALCCRGVVDLACILVLSMPLATHLATRAPRILTSDLQSEEFVDEGVAWQLPPQSGEQLGMLLVVALWCLWTNWIITAISDFVIMHLGLL